MSFLFNYFQNHILFYFFKQICTLFKKKMIDKRQTLMKKKQKLNNIITFFPLFFTFEVHQIR